MPKIITSSTAAASEYRHAGDTSHAIGRNGEINASSRQDLLAQSFRLMSAVARGEVATDGELLEASVRRERNRALVEAAMADPRSNRILGEKMAEQVYMTTVYKGFMRRNAAEQTLRKGDEPRMPVRGMNVKAIKCTGPTRVETQIVTDNYIRPPEFQLTARPFIPENELNQSPTDVLEEKFNEAVQAIMVGEDRAYLGACRAAIGTTNPLTVLTGALSPAALMNVRQLVNQWGPNATKVTMANDLQVDIVADASWATALDPFSRHELVMSGRLGTLYGMEISSEAYRHPEHRVFNPGEFMVTADPAFHAMYTSRGPVKSQPIDGTTENVIGAGWLMSESIALAVLNFRTLAIGNRT